MTKFPDTPMLNWITFLISWKRAVEANETCKQFNLSKNKGNCFSRLFAILLQSVRHFLVLLLLHFFFIVFLHVTSLYRRHRRPGAELVE